MQVLKVPSLRLKEKIDLSQKLNDKYAGKERDNFLMGFIGHNKTGKTTVEKQIAINWKEGRDGNFKIVAFDPKNQLREIADEFILLSDSDDEIKNKIDNSKNSLLILDDIRILHEEDKSRVWLLYLMQQRNDLNIDIIYSVHNPALVLNLLAQFTTHFYIFHTKVQAGGWKRKIPAYVECTAASNYVNDFVKKYGRGDYPNFRYMTVDTENEEMNGVNMH